ncbi:Helicase associated domain protein [Streptomyces uncialis]|uniref:Helicase associated domain protein n=2 Tax=Streptomyces uncialis TaxID=1048205 RepID=UPI0037A291CA
MPARKLLKCSTPRDPAALAAFINLRVLNPEHEHWRRGIEAAVIYAREHGHLKVPFTYRVPAGDDQAVETEGWLASLARFPLGQWIADNRRFYARGDMDTSRAAQLEKLGMIWSHFDVAWEEELAAARGWAEVNGHLLAPLDAAHQGYRVGIWLKNARAAAREAQEIEQRRAEGLPVQSSAGALSDTRREQLEEIAPSWCPAWPVEWQRAFHLVRLHLDAGRELPTAAGVVLHQGEDLVPPVPVHTHPPAARRRPPVHDDRRALHTFQRARTGPWAQHATAPGWVRVLCRCPGTRVRDGAASAVAGAGASRSQSAVRSAARARARPAPRRHRRQARCRGRRGGRAGGAGGPWRSRGGEGPGGLRADPREGGGQDVDRVQSVLGRARAPRRRGGGVSEMAGAHHRQLRPCFGSGRGARAREASSTPRSVRPNSSAPGRCWIVQVRSRSRSQRCRIVRRSTDLGVLMPASVRDRWPSARRSRMSSWAGATPQGTTTLTRPNSSPLQGTFTYSDGGESGKPSKLNNGGPYSIGTYNMLIIVAENGDDSDYNDAIIEFSWHTPR